MYSRESSLYGDNFELARGGAPEQDTPWKKWRRGEDFKYTLIILITGKKAGPVAEILNYDYVRELEDEGILIRHTRQEENILSEKDMTAASVMLQQIWIVGDSREDVIRRVYEIRSKIYKQTQEDAVYPDYWSV